MNQVSDILTTLREEKKLNKSQAAERLGISSQLLGQYESGKRIPKTSFFIKWKQVFGEDLLKKVETNASNEAEGQKKAPSSITEEALHNLTESTQKLSESNLINAKNIDRLITLLEMKANSSVSGQTPIDVAARFSDLLELIARIGTGKRWKSEAEAFAELNKLVPGIHGSGIKAGIRSDLGK